MFSRDQYELIDFGAGRKLERFADIVLDRPAPAAEGAVIREASLWSRATARYDRANRDRGKWSPADRLPESWTLRHGPICLELKPTPFGHLGVFAEQAENWDWIARRCGESTKPLKVLNLFAYTGGSTLAAAAAGARVVHVDAARNVVAWARRNAALSGLADAPIRWICEDAVKFAAREVKRGNRYDAVILDPPSYGRGPGGEIWKLDDQLETLLALCGELMGDKPAFFLLSCHSAGFDADSLAGLARRHVLRDQQSSIDAGALTLSDLADRRLQSGHFVRLHG